MPTPGGTTSKPWNACMAPLQELVPRAVAPELDFHVDPQGVGGGPLVDLNRVVDDEGDRDEGLDDPRIPFQVIHGRAHGRKVHEQRHAREVLEHDSRDDERDFRRPLAPRLPGGEGAHVVFLDPLPVAVAHEGLEDHAEARGQARQSSEALLFELREGVEGPDLSGGGRKRLARAVEGAHRFIVLRGPGRDA